MRKKWHLLMRFGALFSPFAVVGSRGTGWNYWRKSEGKSNGNGFLFPLCAFWG
jgi:hypothetical protein